MYHKWQSYDVWFLRYGAWRTELFVILDHFFLPFYLPKKPKKSQAPGDIIILHKCTKNHDHMLYCSWDIACDRCKLLFFILGFYLPFYPSNRSKNQNFKKWKKCLEISSLYTHVPKIMIRCIQFLRYGVWWVDRQMDRCTNSQKKWHIEVVVPPKNCRGYHHFTQVYQKPQSYDVQFLRFGVRHIFFCHFGLFFAILPP